MKKRFILIDSENVQNRLFEIIENARKKDKIIVFYTVYHSGKLEEYLKNEKKKSNIEFVECIAGNNALDLQLMGVLSYLIHRHPKREFVVYSNDKGYKSLVKHWTSRNVDIELINFITPSVGEDAYAFKSPITVELPGNKTTKKKRTTTGAAGKRRLLNTKKKEDAAPKPEKIHPEQEKAKKEGSPSHEKASAPAKPAAPAKPREPVTHSAQETRREPVTSKKPSPALHNTEQARKKPAAVVDALLFSKKPAASKPENPTVPAAPVTEKRPFAAVQTDVREEEKISQPASQPEAAPVITEPAAPAEPESAAQPKKRGRRPKIQNEQAEASEAVSPEKETEQETVSENTEYTVKTDGVKLSDEEFVLEVCKSVRSTDLALINRVLAIGFGTDGAKEYYSKFKNDPAFREEMGKSYLYEKQERIMSLICTALSFNGLDTSVADRICAIVKEVGLSNMQSVYHSFIKRMPGKVAERQLVYQTIKPYLAILDNL